jgi:hypothetical protein
MARPQLYPTPIVTARAQNIREEVTPYARIFAGYTQAQQANATARQEESVAGLRGFGIGDNAVNYHRWLEESAIYRELIFEALRIAPFIGPDFVDSKAAAITCFYSIGRMQE